MTNRHKISVIGAGNVGSTLAEHIAIKNLGDVALFDVVPNVAEGKALDIMEAGPHWGFDVNLEGHTVSKGGDEYRFLEGSDIVVITAGLARKPGMSRDDLLYANLDIVKSVAENIKKYAASAIVIVVTNPMDIMAYVTYNTTGFPQNRVLGMGGTLDSTRFRTFLAKELNVSVKDVTAFVIGGHGDDMVPFVRFCNVNGMPIESLLSSEKITEIVKRTKQGGGEIVNLLKTGSAYYAPAISIAILIEAILKDEHRTVPVSTYLTGTAAEHYGIKNLFMGVPVKLGKNGVEEILKIDFTESEREAWNNSKASVLENTLKADKKLGISVEH